MRKSLSVGERLYRLLLYLYPRRHREEYGRLMLLHVRDQLRDAREQGRWHVLRCWASVLLDTARTAPAEHLVLAKESMMAIQAHTNFARSEMLSLRLLQGAFAPLGLLLTLVIAFILYDLPPPAADAVPLPAER